MQVKHIVHIQLLAEINKVTNKNRNFNSLYNEAKIKTGRGCNYGNLSPTPHLKILVFFFLKEDCVHRGEWLRGGRDERT